MSPRLLVIADLNMRERGPCRVVRAAPELRISVYVSIPPPASLIIIAAYVFPLLPFFSLLSFSSSPPSLFPSGQCIDCHTVGSTDDVTCLITAPMKCRVRNNYEPVARSYVIVARALVTVIAYGPHTCMYIYIYIYILFLSPLHESIIFSSIDFYMGRIVKDIIQKCVYVYIYIYIYILLSFSFLSIDARFLYGSKDTCVYVYIYM